MYYNIITPLTKCCKMLRKDAVKERTKRTGKGSHSCSKLKKKKKNSYKSFLCAKYIIHVETDQPHIYNALESCW